MPRNEPLPPATLEAEEYVLGAMMISEYAIDAVLDTGLRASDFYRESHGKIFDSIVALHAVGVPADVLTTVAKLEELGQLRDVGGKDRLREIATVVPASSNAAHHANIVQRDSVLRATAIVGFQIQQLGQQGEGELSEILDQVETLVFDLARTRNRTDFVTIQQTVKAAFSKIEELHETGGTIIGLPTGLTVLDGLTSGLQPGNLIVLAARPSMGKTALALTIAANVGVRGTVPVAVFTMEMNRDEITQRLLSSEARIESEKIRNGRLSKEEWVRLVEAGARLDSAKILIDDTPALTAMELRSKARKLKLRHPDLALILVDYIQLMSSGLKSENRVQDVSQTSRSLKVLAAELHVPVIALSQLSRQVESRHDHRPMLSDLRESGAIEQDADLVGFIYRDEYYNPEDTDQHGIAELDVAKHRNGPTGMVKLSFVNRFVRFGNLPPAGAPDDA